MDWSFRGTSSWCVFFMLAFSKPTFFFYYSLRCHCCWWTTVVPHLRHVESCHVSARAFCGGFEGAIRLNLAAKRWQGFWASSVLCLVSVKMSQWVSLDNTRIPFCRVDSLVNTSEVRFVSPSGFGNQYLSTSQFLSLAITTPDLNWMPQGTGSRLF